MPVFRFAAEQTLPYPPDLVFAFFANPENLPRLMPRWQAARIEEATLAPPPPLPPGARMPRVAAGDGTRLLISIRALPLLPIRLPWEAVIENFRWNEGFCDIQTKGPFKSWRHCHTVAPIASTTNAHPNTLLRDEVHYELKLGQLSPLANIVAKQVIAGIFRFRQQQTLALLAQVRPNRD